MKTSFLALLIFISTVASAQTDLIAKGNQLYKAGQFEQAEIQYRKAVEANANDTIALFNLSNALHRQGKHQEAIRVTTTLTKAAKGNEMKSAAYYNQGVSYTKLNNLEASIVSYKNALRQNPTDQQARENLEKALLQQKKQQQQQQKQKQSSDMSQKEADQKLKQLQQREKELQQKMNKKTEGGGQAQDW